MSLSDDDGKTSRRLRRRQVVSGFENFADNSGHVMQYRLAYLQDDAEGEPSSSFVLSGELTCLIGCEMPEQQALGRRLRPLVPRKPVVPRKQSTVQRVSGSNDML